MKNQAIPHKIRTTIVRIHLVDGTYELFRAYFGAPKATGPNGVEVGATRGILWSMLSLLREDRVTHVACAFDHVIESFRNDLFAGYKTSEGVPEDLLAQFPLAERATRALGLVTWPMVEFEADDALATAAARWGDEPEVEQVVICTPDKDMAQCVRDVADRLLRSHAQKADRRAGRHREVRCAAAFDSRLARARRRQLRRLSRRPALGREVGRRRARALRTSRSDSRSRARLGTRPSVARPRSPRACAIIATRRTSIAGSRRCGLMRRSTRHSTICDGAARDARSLTELCHELGNQDFLERVPLWRDE